MQATLMTSEDSAPTESSSSAVNWGPIIAGAFAASSLTFILMLLGSGLGLSMVSPWSGAGASVTTFAVSTAAWLVVVQWLSSGVGGYLTGRLRTKWVGVHTDETYFRDTAHGFLAWALATLLVVGVLGSALSAALGSGVQAASTVAAGTAIGASAGAATKGAAFDTISYYVDTLFRPADPAKLAAVDPQNDAAATAQASRILLASAANGGEVAADDSTYLTQLVAARTGLSQADAKARLDTLIAKLKDAKVKAQQAADTARKASATFALLGALSLVVGAFIASVAAALGGRQRDEEEAIFLANR
ncbi:hypothetical protein [Mesorhizobium sp. 131-2-1]|uniref:hypothetical protein n=1 Tax=Mesorhizobium sp. 131-2-1 TaxID=2744518 RepID=UPI0019259D00|nr:hypothetical protein [Mesorhizobium sp. 131-2-1]BCG96791.1 hypothetical protein MesoLj131a_56550 [Mesorhizobium sp. 131-2-1]